MNKNSVNGLQVKLSVEQLKKVSLYTICTHICNLNNHPPQDLADGRFWCLIIGIEGTPDHNPNHSSNCIPLGSLPSTLTLILTRTISQGASPLGFALGYSTYSTWEAAIRVRVAVYVQ